MYKSQYEELSQMKPIYHNNLHFVLHNCLLYGVLFLTTLMVVNLCFKQTMWPGGV